MPPSLLPPETKSTLKGLNLWLPSWQRRDKVGEHVLGVRHIMIAVCDHFDPKPKGGQRAAEQHLARWKEGFARLTEEFKDADGEPPKHTFFYPIEQYDRELVGNLTEVCQATGSELEIRLEHENDTADHLRQTLEQGIERLSSLGHLAVDADNKPRYGFIHGHGALDNSHPEGCHCGVQNELAVLQQTGCYADFSMPSAPELTQTQTINSLYYARPTGQNKSHDQGRSVYADRDAQPAREDELLMVQGPLGLDWGKRKYGVIPRIEDGWLTAENPPTVERMRLWMECRVCVKGRPNWYFAKLHTRSSRPENLSMLLGEPMRAFYRGLAKLAEKDNTLRFHFVTARELVNILHAAESGHRGDPHPFRNYRYRRASDAVAAVG